MECLSTTTKVLPTCLPAVDVAGGAFIQVTGPTEIDPSDHREDLEQQGPVLDQVDRDLA